MNKLVIAEKSEIVAIADQLRALVSKTEDMSLGEMAAEVSNANVNKTDILSALVEKGIDTTDAGLSDIAALVAGIKAAEEGNVFEITPAQTGIIYPDVNVEDNVRGVICLRVNAYPDYSPTGDGSSNKDAKDVPFCASILIEKYGLNGSQYRITNYNQSSSYFSPEISKSLATINYGSTSDSSNTCALVYNANKNKRLTLYVGDPGSRGLRVGATYCIVLI